MVSLLLMRTPAKDGAARKATRTTGCRCRSLLRRPPRGAASGQRARCVSMPRWLWLDVLGKVQEDVVVRSTASSIVTLLAWIAITLVVVGEVNYHFSPQPVAEVGIDRTGIHNMEIDFTIRLPELPCDNFGVDALDASGNMLLEVKTNIKKEKLPTSRGCKVIGKLFVNKVAGEFHIGFGRDTEPVHQDGLDSMEGNHIHRFTMQQARDFNTSHIVDHMGFTVPLAEAKYNGLLRSLGMTADRFAMNGHTEIVPKNSARFLYFLNVVAVCNRRWGTPVYGYEYVFRLHTIPVDTSQPRFWQPGIFFKYDLQPYVMNYGVEERSFPETALRCVATVGGIYVVAGWASSFIHYIQNPRKQIKK